MQKALLETLAHTFMLTTSNALTAFRIDVSLTCFTVIRAVPFNKSFDPLFDAYLRAVAKI